MPTKNHVWRYSLPAALLLMAPFDILASLAMDIYLPIVPAMPGILGTSPAVVQLTLSLYMVMLGLGQIVFGPVSDRIGRRPVLIGGAMLFAAASFCLAASSSAIPFVAFRFLQAVGASAALVATFATIRDVYADRPESVVIYSLFSSILAFVPALGPIAGAMLAERFGWRSIFVTLGAFAVIALLQALPRWHESRPSAAALSRHAFGPLFRSLAFWTYTLGFSAAMGTFFVFFSTSPRVLIDKAGYSELQFSLAFATVAIVMIITARFAERFVSRWGTSGSLLRGMCMLLLGAALLIAGETFGVPSSWTFVMPMWVMAVGIVFTVSVTANGALEDFGDMAGSAVAVYFCVQSLIVGTAGTLLVIGLPGDSAWPLVVYASIMAGVVLIARRQLHSRRHVQA
ncbi:CmlA/FloR family chloramphenicol efflux MFS transporter [Sinorhizobium meliloti WSM1022]|jgi:MFS transporter, DHA1 family, chloramphenicol/florfenicol resistance protein|uniref:CmlA/FloR family chloramphenicol efflux MFS transporter n=1 Tax=Rhizobium meliloti TaxID=382 RepID=UPI0003F9BBEE|nr:CmlA/FloR family chloramphenicol efflux MFS transporter [Sinorhizobium meliloti]ASQ03047.1 chloramphenicol efflux pump [Sinorhizobium meliloti]MCO6425351.1 CmlA/FloR family chloramphenicol efflux MFS transporter [Sinorhizobium meliloti]MDW9411248.1 CmlA/FloR family chloramphenicol efflux MFS transporter [Sinorhizobium meliloti]MDW9443772.1 CmlA/FloR family chloramphenicol efflux MFS transporter [Sinorhizobium meliloti]MDW9456586.1 CmlA/FloR family chloramphenicol efflux MFS transporter [Sin